MISFQNWHKQQPLLQKGVYRYEHMDSWERFTDPISPQEASYSKVSDDNIREEDYTHAQKVWTAFWCKDMGDYHDLYLDTDVLLLAGVFETFRKTCKWQYGLDPAHHYTNPGLSCEAFLKKTSIELKLLMDYDQHLFINKGLRSVISMVSKCHAKTNNPHVDAYDSSKPIPILYTSTPTTYSAGPLGHEPSTANKRFEWV